MLHRVASCCIRCCIRCWIMLYHAVSCCITLHHVAWCCDMLYHVVWYCIMPVISCWITLHHVESYCIICCIICWIMLNHVVSCCIIILYLCCIISHRISFCCILFLLSTLTLTSFSAYGREGSRPPKFYNNTETIVVNFQKNFIYFIYVLRLLFLYILWHFFRVEFRFCMNFHPRRCIWLPFVLHLAVHCCFVAFLYVACI